jgi:hypothetical protein
LESVPLKSRLNADNTLQLSTNAGYYFAVQA